MRKAPSRLVHKTFDILRIYEWEQCIGGVNVPT